MATGGRPLQAVLLLLSHSGVSSRSGGGGGGGGGVGRSRSGGVSGGGGGRSSVGRRGGFSGGGRGFGRRSGFLSGLAAGGQRSHGGQSGDSQSDFLHYNSPEMTEGTPDTTTVPESPFGPSEAYSHRNRRSSFREQGVGKTKEALQVQDLRSHRGIHAGGVA